MSAMMAIETMGKPGLALDIPKNQSFDQWVEMGRSLCEGQRVVNWWIGDWWAAGSHRYGERAKAAAEGIFGREFQTLANAASVCRSFEGSRRREVLSFTHHQEVAALPPQEADALLDEAEASNLSTRDLRVKAMKRKVALGLFPPKDQAEPDPEYSGFINIGRAHNREQHGSRMLYLQSIEEMGVIAIVDPSKLGDVPL